MKFLLRCLLVLAIAVALGVMLYYAVQALPGASPSLSAPGAQLEPQNGNNAPRPEGSRDDQGGGIRPRSVVGVVGKAILFSVIVFVSVIAKNIVFQKKPSKTQDS